MIPSIATLPTELLIQVFHLWICSYYISPLPRKGDTAARVTGSYSASAIYDLLLVCRHWHTVVMSNPSLWSVLDLRSDERVTKMLEMSDQTPLIVRSRSMPRGYRPDEEWSRRVRSIVDDHITRIEELDLTGPCYSISKGLEAVSSNVPLLRRLRLVGSKSINPAFLSLPLPPTVESWVASQLEELVLEELNMSWKSALLQSCHRRLLHLGISLESKEVIPLHHLMTQRPAPQLSHMTLLRTLSLRGELHLVTTEQSHSGPIRLPNLTHLDLSGSEFECRKIWDMVELPHGCKVSLHCIYSDPSSAIPELFPSMEKFLCWGKDRGDCVQHLEMSGCGELRCEFWMQRPPGSCSRLPNSKPHLSIRFCSNVFQLNVDITMLHLLMPFLTVHIIPHLRSLYLGALPSRGDSSESHPDWPRLLGGATQLTSLTCQDMHLCHITTLLSSSSVHSSICGSPYALAALESLELTEVEVVDRGILQQRDDGVFQALKQCLHARGQAHAGPNVLSITGRCYSMNNRRHEELKEVVPTVIWEPVENRQGTRQRTRQFRTPDVQI